MRIGPSLVLAFTLVFASVPAFGQGLTITINNDSTNNLYVTVYDMSTQPPLKVIANALVNGNASITVSISPDSSGKGSLKWMAMTVGRDMRTCGHGAKRRLNDGDAVSVTADSECSGQ